MSLSTGAQEALFIGNLMKSLKLSTVKIQIGIDNQGAMSLAANPLAHTRSKHIDTRHHFIREVLQSGRVLLYYVESKDNNSDVFTKPKFGAAYTIMINKLEKPILEGAC